MITTAVHQTSQLLEIQGAPSPAPTGGDDFRATFAASVSGTAPRKTSQNIGQGAGGSTAAAAALASAKNAAAARPIAKAASLAANGAIEGQLELKDASTDASGVETLAEAGAASDLKASSGLAPDLAVKDAAAADAVIKTDAAGNLAAQLSSEAQARLDVQDAASLPLPGTASVAVAALEETKDARADKSPDGATVRGHKQEEPVSNQEAGAATAGAAGSAFLASAALAVPVVPTDTTVLAQALQAGRASGLEVAQKGTKQGVLTSLADASDDATAVAGSSAVEANKDGLDSTAAGLEELASLQQEFASPVSGAISRAQRNAALAAPSRTEAAVQPGAGGETPAKVTSIAAPGTASAAAPHTVETDVKSSAGAAQTKSVSAANSAGVRAGALVETTEAAAATQARAIAQPRPVLSAQPQIASRAVLSKTPAIAAAQTAETEAKGPATAVLAPTVTSAPAGAADGEIKLAQQVVAGSDAPAVYAPVTEASPRTASTTIAAAKDDKTKPASAAPDGTSSAQQIAAQSFSAETSNGSAGLAAAALNGVPRLVPVAESAGTVAAAGNIVASSSHASVAAAVPAPAARVLSPVIAGQLAEPASSVGQAGEPHRTLLATPTTLEVGVPSGTQGWLRIRAEVGGPGEVNASLSAASSGARELLHSQMPALNAFLHSEQLAVTATVAERGTTAAGGQGAAAWGTGGTGAGLGTALGAGTGSDASGGSNASLLHGGGAQSGGSQREAAQPLPDVSASERVSSYDARGGTSDRAAALSGGIAVSEESGRWLNVRV